MLDENKVENRNRFLIAIALVSETSVKEGCSNEELYKKLGGEYVQKVEAFINRVHSENEVIVYTLYAYADFLVPKSYDIIFDRYNIDNFVETSFTLKYSFINISSYFMLVDEIAHGHKHVCVLNFDNGIPDILKQLPDVRDIGKSPLNICLCQKQDFEAIRHNLKRPKLTEG